CRRCRLFPKAAITDQIALARRRLGQMETIQLSMTSGGACQKPDGYLASVTLHPPTGGRRYIRTLPSWGRGNGARPRLLHISNGVTPPNRRLESSRAVACRRH